MSHDRGNDNSSSSSSTICLSSFSGDRMWSMWIHKYPNHCFRLRKNYTDSFGARLTDQLFPDSRRAAPRRKRSFHVESLRCGEFWDMLRYPSGLTFFSSRNRFRTILLIFYRGTLYSKSVSTSSRGNIGNISSLPTDE